MESTKLFGLPLAFFLLAVTTASPVPGDRWTQPCGVDITPSTGTVSQAALANRSQLLKTDAYTIVLAANELKTFTISRIGGQNVADSLDKVNAHMDNFPHDFLADESGVMTVEMLRGDYKNLSRVAIFFEKMIENVVICANAEGKVPMDNVKEAVYAMLCHVDETLAMMGAEPATPYEKKEDVLPSTMNEIPASCFTNDSERRFIDYVNARDALGFSQQLYLQYTTVLNSNSNGTK